MSKIVKYIRRIILSVLGFFGIMSFTACYGMPPEDDDISGPPSLPTKKEFAEMVVMYGMPPNYETIKDEDIKILEELEDQKDSEQAAESETPLETQTE